MFWATLVLLLALTTGLGQAASLSNKIKEKEGAIDGKKAKEGVLTADISGFTSRIDSLQADISGLQAKESKLQADLDAKLARLSGIQADLRAERARLARLRAKLANGREALSKRLVELYKADSPDVLTVVLNSHGFADLLENCEFARRIGRQDNRILTTVKDAKAESTVAAAKLDDLEDDATQVAAVVQSRRDEVASVKGDLVVRRDSYATRALGQAHRARVHQGGPPRARGRPQGPAGRGGQDPGAPGRRPDQRRRAQAGLGRSDLAGQRRRSSPRSASAGAACTRASTSRSRPARRCARPPAAPSRIAGWVSGYGNYVCIQHAGSLSTCYGHNTSLAVHVGQSVSQGQVISSSGCTGHCYGPHVHFETRINGAPVDPMGYL